MIHGRVAALIELGSGFHPELTGRENVYLSGAILGMRRREIATKLERIVEFAGVRQFIDTPVKWYSSGMYVRLGFAVAAHMEPDILLVDEVLAVGDAEFQVKCLQRIQELKNQGTTSLLISHDLTAVERLCDRAVLLEAGTIAATGTPADVVATYHRRLALWDPPSGETSLDSPKSGVALTNLTFHKPDEPRAVSFKTGEPLTVSLRYAAAKPIPNVEFELRVLLCRRENADCVAANRRAPRVPASDTARRRHRVHLRRAAAEAGQLLDRSRGSRRRDLEDSRVVGWREPAVRPKRPGH